MSVLAGADTIAARWAASSVQLWLQLKTNPRALLGLMAIACLLTFYGLLKFSDINDAQRSEYRQQIIQARRDLAIKNEKDWPARAKESAATREALEKRMWQFDSEGVALANLQDWVTSAGTDAGLSRLQVTIDTAKPKELGGTVVQFTATITATQTEEALRKFLEKIEREPHLLVVDQMHVQQRPPSLQMTLVTYAKIAAPSGAAK